MKTCKVFLTAIVVVALSVVASQAATVGLLYDYGLDGNANNLAGPAANGTLAGTTVPTFEAGVIGQAMNTGTAGYVDLGTGAYPQAISPYASGSTDGFWTGTVSFWTNSVAGANSGTNWMTGWTADGFVNTGVFQNWPASGTVGYYALLGGHTLQIWAAAPTSAIEDENWHLITVSYNLTTGATGTGSGQMWIDGTPQTVTTSGSGNGGATGGNTIDGTETISTPTINSLATDYYYNRNAGFDGKVDDMARWYTQLGDGQAKALYNLGITGVAGTVYNAADATSLFDGFLNAAGASTSDSKSWNDVASGLSGAAGSVGSNYVVLNGSGGGMQLQAAGPVTWTGASDMTWSNTANWSPASTPNGVDVTFGNTATGTVANITAAATPSSVTFDNTGINYSVTGATYGIGGAATVLKKGTGTVTISSTNNYTGLTTLQNGKLLLQAGAKTPVLSGAGIDIQFGKLVLDYNDSGTSPAAVDTLMKTSYAGGTWAGGKFQSTTASTANTLGWKADTINKLITVEYTLYGDANVDGSVNLSDLGFLGDNYGLTTGATWAMGDFNYDGRVNLSDLGFLGDQYGGHVAGFVTAGPANPAPSPTRWCCWPQPRWD